MWYPPGNSPQVPGCNLKSERYASWIVRLRPSRFNLWVAPFIFGAVGIFFLWSAYQNLVDGGDVWLTGAIGVGWIALAVFGRNFYIQVDDSTITFGPAVTAFAARRNIINRREVVLIRATHSPLTRRSLFLRSDGSTLRGTPGLLWGRDGLQTLADYLGVPLEW